MDTCLVAKGLIRSGGARGVKAIVGEGEIYLARRAPRDTGARASLVKDAHQGGWFSSRLSCRNGPDRVVEIR